MPCRRSSQRRRTRVLESSRIRHLGWVIWSVVCLLAPAVGGFASSYSVEGDGLYAKDVHEIRRGAMTEPNPGSLPVDSELGVFGAEDAG